MARRSKQNDKSATPLGEVIRRLRTQRGLNQVELADAVPMSRAYLSEIENGAQDNPSVQVVNKIIDTLGVSRDQFHAEMAIAEAARLGKPFVMMAIPKAAAQWVREAVAGQAAALGRGIAEDRAGYQAMRREDEEPPVTSGPQP